MEVSRKMREAKGLVGNRVILRLKNVLGGGLRRNPLSFPQVVGAVVLAVVVGVSLGGGGVYATGATGDSCYQLEWYTTTGTATTSSNNPSHDIDNTKNTKHESNRVCYDDAHRKIYAEEITGSEPLALGVKGDYLCLLTAQDGGGYAPGKCTTDWTTTSIRTGFTIFDEGALTEMVGAAGGNVAQIGVGGAGAEERGDDFVEAAQLVQTDEELEALVGVDTVGDIIGEQSAEETAEAEEQKNGETTCAGSGAGESLGWVLCPVLQLMGKVSGEIYNKYVKPALEVDPVLFTDSNGGGTREAWETFRNIANVAFIVLLLVVIFSQLTGVGIDNYGIKKILPKLIVAAVLINLSYLICVIAVDLSNILGNGLQALFEGLPPNDWNTNFVNDDGKAIGASVGKASGFISVALIGIFVGAAGMAIINPAILVSLIVSALGILVAIFFLFILLAGREAAIVVLTVISPLAFACFMLPNTKKLFDKWWKFGQGLLIVYPICGLLIGGGNYVSKLILVAQGGSAGFMTALTAMLIGVAPIFFIPSVIKGSFAAMGKMGATITGLGAKARGASTKAVRGSEMYKNMQAAGLERQTRIRGGIDRNGNPSTGFRRVIGNIASGGPRSRRRNALQYQKIVAERGSLEAADQPDFMLKTQTDNELKRITASGEINNLGSLDDNGKGSGMTGSLYSALMSNDRAKIRAYTDALTAQGESGRDAVKQAYNVAAKQGMSANSARTFAANITANHASDYKSNNRSLFEVASGINSGGGRNGQGKFATTDEYLARGMIGDDGKGVDGVGRLISKAKSETIGSMDDSSFAETFFSVGQNGKRGDYATNGQANLANIDTSRIASLPSDQRAALGQNVYNALQNTTNMDTVRVAYLRKILSDSGYKPDRQRVTFK